MAYRDDLDAAHARITALERELAQLRGEAPPPLEKKGILDEISDGLDQFGRDVRDLWERGTKSRGASSADDRERIVAALEPLDAADRALLEQIAVILRTERDPVRRATKVRALIEASEPDPEPPAS